MATIITKNSQTASAVPAAASLSVGELAVNTADGKLYTEHTGGVVKEIIPSTVVNGGITEAKIADGAVTTNKLSNSGVTANTYGSSSAIPIVTVDAKGRITSASTTSFSATPADGSITDPKIADGLTAGSNYSKVFDAAGGVPPNTSYRKVAEVFVYRGGVMNFQTRLYNGNIGSENTSTVSMQLYYNGSSISSVVSQSLATNATSGVLTLSNVTVPAGGLLQVYVANSGSGNNIAQINYLNFGISNVIKLAPFANPTYTA
jgi:hypothetical protein